MYEMNQILTGNMNSFTPATLSSEYDKKPGDILYTVKGRGKWSAPQAHDWVYKQKKDVGGPLIGCNFIPSDAGNQLEMWQEETFNPDLIDKELGMLSEMCNFNTTRVFLHSLAWQQDPEGMKKRIGDYLDVAGKHGFKTMFVFFDSCWNDDAKIGPQENFKEDVHNSMWLQDPPREIREDESKQAYLETYVKDIVGTFREHPGILAWDVYNEPCNLNHDEPRSKLAEVEKLLKKTIRWTREMNPTQPLTTAPWNDFYHEIPERQLEESEIKSFHCYDSPEMFLNLVESLENRKVSEDYPLFCSEFMVRAPSNNRLKHILPIMAAKDVGGTIWGSINGRSNTHVPWERHREECWKGDCKPSFHDILDKYGNPIDNEDIEALMQHTKKGITGKVTEMHRANNIGEHYILPYRDGEPKHKFVM